MKLRFGNELKKKNGVPIDFSNYNRPIAAYKASFNSYNCSMSLTDLLGPLVVLTAYQVRNYKHLVETLSTVMIEDDEVFASRSVCIHKNIHTLRKHAHVIYCNISRL